MSDTKRVRLTNDAKMNERCINTIRVLAADVVQKANSGHPGAPMGCAPMAHALFGYVMNFSTNDTKWANRDRFVLSNGHACALQYTMLHLTGYDVSMDDLKAFRQVESKTPGHPENHLTQGVEVSTGPLGQGISNGVGLAIAERHLAATYNQPGFDIVDHFTYVICGDGCLQEGVSAEACSLAGHLGLGKLIVLYDDNHIQIDGSTDLAFGEDVIKRYDAYGWHTVVVGDGDSTNLKSLLAAIEAAQGVTDKPSLIKIRTTIGIGSAKEGTHKVHGSPLGDDDIKKVKAKFGLNPDESFTVGDDVRAYYTTRREQGNAAAEAWQSCFASYTAKHPELAAQFLRTQSGALPAGWEDVLPKFPANPKGNATRKDSKAVLEKLVAKLPELLGGSADLTPSNLTKVAANELDFTPSTPAGRYMRYGVREHGMCAIANGLAAHGGIIPYVATFLTFAGYALGAMRVCALSNFRVIYVFTHDSIGVGEDGPTHQPVETLATLRSLPNFYTFRPADGTETAGAYAVALKKEHSPSLLALSRQGLPDLELTATDKVALGAYPVSKGFEASKVILIASGSEVSLCFKARELLEASGTKVGIVSLPCYELFDEQSAEYKASVLLPGVPVLAVEAAVELGWHKFSHAQHVMKGFGMSGPGGKVYAHFKFTPETVAAKATKLIAHFAGKPAPALGGIEL